MKYGVILYKENENSLISTVLPFEIINKNSHVLIYGKDEGGYQREPDIRHYGAIKKYVLEDPNFIFPTSIILGVDEEEVGQLITKEGNTNLISFEGVAENKLFRVVDGQHRLKGLQEAAVERPLIAETMLSVTIVVTPKGKRSLEMELFNTINSKSKRIKVDLIQLASYEYRILESRIPPDELNAHIAMQVANLLNEDDNSTNVWHNAIKFGIHEEQKIGIIGVNAFRESLKQIVARYLEIHIEHKDLSGSPLINFSRIAAEEIKKFMFTIWNEIVFNKWPGCFSGQKEDLDSNYELQNYSYNSEYYLQKTLGAKAINYLVGRKLTERGFDNSTLEVISGIIEKSELLTSDWIVGKTFSGYSSESAFNKVVKIIEGELPVPRD